MPRYTDKQIEEGLRNARGMVYAAARQMGCSPDTIKARLGKSEKLRKIKDDETEIVLDTAELKLVQAMTNGEAWAIKYLLATKGKDRGYVERMEQSGPGGRPIQQETKHDFRVANNPKADAAVDAFLDATCGGVGEADGPGATGRSEMD